MALPRDYLCNKCRSLIRAWEPKGNADTGWLCVRCLGSASGKQVRCCECDFTIDSGKPRIATVFGWAHPVCVPGGDAA
jgi:hypothetical protein